MDIKSISTLSLPQTGNLLAATQAKAAASAAAKTNAAPAPQASPQTSPATQTAPAVQTAQNDTEQDSQKKSVKSFKKALPYVAGAVVLAGLGVYIWKGKGKGLIRKKDSLKDDLIDLGEKANEKMKKGEKPKTEVPKAEEIKADGTKPENPKPEAPKADGAKAEDKKPDAPKAEEPKADGAKAEDKKPDAPKAEEPKADGAKAEDKKPDAPKAEEPKADGAKAEDKKPDAPKAEEPKADGAKAEDKKPDAPKAEEPKADGAKAEDKKANAPKAKKSKAENPKTDANSTQDIKKKINLDNKEVVEKIKSIKKQNEPNVIQITNENNRDGHINLAAMQKVATDFMNDVAGRGDARFHMAADFLEQTYIHEFIKTEGNVKSGLNTLFEKMMADEKLALIYSKMPLEEAACRIDSLRKNELANCKAANEMTLDEFFEKVLAKLIENQKA